MKVKIIDSTINIISYKAEILSRVAKATGNKNSLNIEFKEPLSMCNQWGNVNFNKVNDIVINNINIEEARW